MNLQINESFNKELPADPDKNNTRRQVKKACFSYVNPRVPGKPSLIHFSPEMIEAIGLNPNEANAEEFLNVFSGSKTIDGSTPYAMCYGGHQFGSWAGQLGDGRAINLTELIHNNKRWMLQLKGAGETPYSRSADGLAVLRSSIREHLCSEAMYHLGVPTTRSLSLMLTGDKVLRDVMYDGNSAYEKGAVVCRVAPSFIRFGNFQILAAQNDLETLRVLCNYTIRHFYPHLKEDSNEGVIGLFNEVVNATMNLMVEWQRVGFVHGVMNTDNMSILSQTIDYGPYGWLEGYDPNWTPNTTDRTHSRYRFGNQPKVALWNLVQLGNAFYPLIKDAAPLEEILNTAFITFQNLYLQMMRNKMGLKLELDEDQNLIDELESVLQLSETDMTIFFRNLSNINSSTDCSEKNFMNPVIKAFYKPEELNAEILQEWRIFLGKYVKRLQLEKIDNKERIKVMNQNNPKYVLRNYMAQLAIDDANKGDYKLIEELYKLLRKPYDEQPMASKWFAKRPEWARHKVGCSMLSCSS